MKINETIKTLKHNDLSDLLTLEICEFFFSSFQKSN